MRRAWVVWFACGVALVSISGAGCNDAESAKVKVSPGAGRGGTAGSSTGRGGAGASIGASGAPGAGGSGDAGIGNDAGAGGTSNPTGGTGGGTNSGGSDASGSDGVGTAGSGDASAGGSTSAGGSNAGGAGGRVATAGKGGSSGRASGGAGAGTSGAGGRGGSGTAGSGPIDLEELYISLTGDDSRSGRRDDPLATLEFATSVVAPLGTIIFLDGDFDVPAPPSPMQVPDGVQILAENPGQVRLIGEGGTLLSFAGRGYVTGIEFDGYETPLQFVQATGGGFEESIIESSSFTNCTGGGPAIEVDGSYFLYLYADPDFEWGNCGGFVEVGANGFVDLTGGILRAAPATPGAALFRVSNDESYGGLTIHDLQVIDSGQPFVVASGGAEIAIVDTTVSVLSDTIITASGTTMLDISGSELAVAPAAPVRGPCVDFDLDVGSYIRIYGTPVHGCSTGIQGTVYEFRYEQGEVYDLTAGAFDLAVVDPYGQALFDTAIVHDSGPFGIRVDAATRGFGAVGAIWMIDSTLTNTDDCVRLDGDVAANFDLGYGAFPGNNTFQCDVTGVRVGTPAGSLINAVGSTWHPNVQGADADGHYAGLVEVTSGSGQNYDLGAGATLRLADD